MEGQVFPSSMGLHSVRFLERGKSGEAQGEERQRKEDPTLVSEQKSWYRVKGRLQEPKARCSFDLFTSFIMNEVKHLFIYLKAIYISFKYPL